MTSLEGSVSKSQAAVTNPSRQRNHASAAEIKTEGGVPEESKEDDGIEDEVVEVDDAEDVIGGDYDEENYSETYEEEDM